MFKRIRPSLSKIIPIVIIIIFAFTYRDVLRSMVLVPLAYLIFIFRLIAGSIGQQTLWVSFVVLSTIIAVISLAMRSEKQIEKNPVEHKYPTRLQTWVKTVRRKERSEYFKWNLAQDLSNLFVEAIAYHQGLSHSEALRQLEAGKIDLPPDILAYLRISQKPFAQTGLANYENGNWLSQVWNTLRRQPVPQREKSPLDLEPEKIIRYLEDYLGLDAEIWQG